MEVFLLWHVRHARWLDGRPTTHRDEAGELVWDEEDGDDLKILGAYSSEARAEDRIQRARKLPGFRDEPDCFYIDGYTVDQDQWNDGFVSIPRDDQAD
ncbi:hypothetical protein DLE60_16595 [Micromonospora globispora]|uniref:DUF7336 domain-containing protein n=1 Tax=Micromonospora globispora TaxID=1450148 RepID=A0A317JZN5_9ACTN|nr:hypothetical protein [Micromonospora globispora]PWU46257.1 hypothetical protein DLJ46_18605 [Micromonospora globispora]PWU59398.1 hypothetical protein DLE60_16595 [Micromonospora globispora]RQW93031.1 hypothetical protein DKL51_17950 [Micromonospora globispora]